MSMTLTRPGRQDSRPGPAAPAPRRRRRNRVDWWAIAMIAPALIGLAALYLWPFLSTFVKSFMNLPVFGTGTFTGIDNYARLLTDEDFWRALGNSALYTALVLLGIPIAIVLAALIEQAAKGRTLYRVLFFLPVVTLPVAVGMVWRFILNGDFGILASSSRSRCRC
jgi:multiple sugar transport system permease protein